MNDCPRAVFIRHLRIPADPLARNLKEGLCLLSTPHHHPGGLEWVSTGNLVCTFSMETWGTPESCVYRAAPALWPLPEQPGQVQAEVQAQTDSVCFVSDNGSSVTRGALLLENQMPTSFAYLL